jgi:hypothetical protein
MPMLGDLLAAARRGAGDFLTWLRASDPALATAVESAAQANQVTPTSFVRSAIADFSQFASEEDWATLSSNLKKTEDPGTACLLAMVDWRLTVKACQQHAHHHLTGDLADDRSQ